MWTPPLFPFQNSTLLSASAFFFTSTACVFSPYLKIKYYNPSCCQIPTFSFSLPSSFRITVEFHPSSPPSSSDSQSPPLPQCPSSNPNTQHRTTPFPLNFGLNHLPFLTYSCPSVNLLDNCLNYSSLLCPVFPLPLGRLYRQPTFVLCKHKLYRLLHGLIQSTLL